MHLEPHSLLREKRVNVLPRKRLASLDAMRGFTILAMIPFHVLLFGVLRMGLVVWGGEGGVWTLPELVVVEWDPPLATGLIFFFFVTGASLAVSLVRRSERQSTSTMARRVILRYGGYVLFGVIAELIMWHLVMPERRVLYFGETSVLESISHILLGSVSFTQAIFGVALGAIIAFPLILKLSWKKLVAASLVLTLIVGLVLYDVVLPQASSLPLDEPSLLNLFLTGMFAILKGLPMILLGAATWKLVVDRRDLERVFLLVGGGIGMAYILVPLFFGTGLLHMLLAVWAYHHAMIFMASASLCLFALIRILEARNVTLTPLTVFGRSSILTFYGHILLDLGVMGLIGRENLTIGVLLGIIIVVTPALWIPLYFYSRRRWGPPSTWYR